MREDLKQSEIVVSDYALDYARAHMNDVYTLNSKTNEITSPDGRFYCYKTSWDISPAMKAGYELIIK